MLNRGRLDELGLLYSPPELAEVLQSLAGEMSAAVARIRSASDEQDQAAVAKAAHELRNSARLVGAEELSAAAVVLDRGDGRGPATTPEQLRAVFDAWGRVRAALAAEVGAL